MGVAGTEMNRHFGGKPRWRVLGIAVVSAFFWLMALGADMLAAYPGAIGFTLLAILGALTDFRR